MAFPVHITFRGMAASPALEDTIRACAAKLEHLHGRIATCDVVVEVPHRHQRQGRHFHVRLTLAIPGDDIIVSRDPGHHDSHEDAHVAVRHAFDAARRQLVDHIARLRADLDGATGPDAVDR